MLDPGVRLVDEATGDVIGYLPVSAPTLSADDEIVYTEVGGGSVTYKIEKVRYVAEYSTVVMPDSLDRYTCYGRTDYIVSA